MEDKQFYDRDLAVKIVLALIEAAFVFIITLLFLFMH